MKPLAKIYLIITFAPLLIIILILSMIFLINDSSSTTASVVSVSSTSDFIAPFKDGVHYSISSPFGYRSDPATGKNVLHNGIDLVAPKGTDIVASASGRVWRTGYETGGLGNYVKIEHDVNGTKYYTAYGHMSDNSIVVSEGELVNQGQKLGVIGKSGYATGIHVHFMLMTPNCTYKESDVKDPRFIIDEDLQRRNQNKQ